jgi:anaerobic carbon-monoxide dehydrogenase catalytic subunit
MEDGMMLEQKPRGNSPRRDMGRTWPKTACFEDKNAAPLRLAKAIRIGMVRGVVSLAGRHGPLLELVRELIRQDLFVVVTGNVTDLAEAGLLDSRGRDEAGVGLAEFCALCDIPPVWHMTEEEGPAPLESFCARLATALTVDIPTLPVAASLTGENLEALLGPPGQTLTDAVGLAEAIGRRITIKRLALGLNDRFDGSMYS